MAAKTRSRWKDPIFVDFVRFVVQIVCLAVLATAWVYVYR